MPLAPVNLEQLNSVFNRLAKRGIPYRLGGKIPLNADPADPRISRGVDCSGFARYALFKATKGRLTIPDGSWMQHDWCRNEKLHQLAKYPDVTLADASRLFIAFITPETSPDGIGHVWLIHRAQGHSGAAQDQPTTLESYGHHGIGSRPWNARTLLTKVSDCYELPAI